MLSYTKSINKLSDIYNHLKETSSLFFPALDTRVDLNEYAIKLHNKANNLEAWHNEELVGLVSYYLNDQLNEVFVTNVSVLEEFQGVGIATKLLNIMFDDQDVRNKFRIRLYANSKDEKLIGFYKKLGFYLGSKSGDQNEMIYRLHEVSPLVSICCVTYNHEQYIRQCLEGFLIQKTNFPFEILIHDDASKDRTPDIIRDYESQYPDIIKPIFQTENQYSKGESISLTYNWPRVKGQYIAMCEGDDYWIDQYKLQKQVDFLQSNKDYSMCFHEAIVHWENDKYEDKVLANLDDREYTEVDIYKKWIVATSSVMYLSKIAQSQELIINLKSGKFIYGDIILFLTAAKFGRLFGFSEIMSVYRRHANGLVFDNDGDEDREKRYLHNKAIGQVYKGKIKKEAIKICARLCFNYSIDYFFKKKYSLFFNYFRKGFISHPPLFIKLLFEYFAKKSIKIMTKD